MQHELTQLAESGLHYPLAQALHRVLRLPAKRQDPMVIAGAAELALRYLAAIAFADYLASGMCHPRVEKDLADLSRPSLGHRVGFLDGLTEALSSGGVRPFCPELVDWHRKGKLQGGLGVKTALGRMAKLRNDAAHNQGEFDSPVTIERTKELRTLFVQLVHSLQILNGYALITVEGVVRRRGMDEGEVGWLRGAQGRPPLRSAAWRGDLTQDAVWMLSPERSQALCLSPLFHREPGPPSSIHLWWAISDHNIVHAEFEHDSKVPALEGATLHHARRDCHIVDITPLGGWMLSPDRGASAERAVFNPLPSEGLPSEGKEASFTDVPSRQSNIGGNGARGNARGRRGVVWAASAVAILAAAAGVAAVGAWWWGGDAAGSNDASAESPVAQAAPPEVQSAVSDEAAPVFESGPAERAESPSAKAELAVGVAQEVAHSSPPPKLEPALTQTAESGRPSHAIVEPSADPSVASPSIELRIRELVGESEESKRLEPTRAAPEAKPRLIVPALPTYQMRGKAGLDGSWTLTTQVLGAEYSNRPWDWVGKVRGHYQLDIRGPGDHSEFAKVGDSGSPNGLYADPYKGRFRWESYEAVPGVTVHEAQIDSQNGRSYGFSIHFAIILVEGRLYGIWNHLGHAWSKDGMWGILEAKRGMTTFMNSVALEGQPCLVRCFVESQPRQSTSDFERGFSRASSDPSYQRCMSACK